MSKGTPKGLSTLAVSAGAQQRGQGAGSQLRHNTLGPHGERAHVAPLHLSSNFEYDSAQAADAAAEGAAFLYSRHANPTVEDFERAVAELEGAEGACAFSSGMGALSATVLGLAGGGAVVMSDGIYGGTTELATTLGPSLGLHASFVPAWDTHAVQQALRARPKVLLLETISNPLLRIADLPQLAALCAEAGTALVVDATFASPYLNQPLSHGATAVVHSASKYISGHGDVIAGVVAAAPDVLAPIREHRKLLGSNLGPFEAFLALRGLRTLPLRMQRQCENALALAQHLAAHPKVKAVHHPGLPSHPDHERAQRLLAKPGAMVTFELASLKAARSFYDRIEVIRRAASLGSVASLVTHPVSFSHKGVAEPVRLAAGITDGLLRVSVGIEDIADLLADVDQALEHST